MAATPGTFKDADLLEMASEEMRGTVTSRLMSMNSQLFVTSKDITTVANQSKYDIPADSIGNKVKDVVFVDTSGTEIDVVMIDTKAKSNLGIRSGSGFGTNFGSHGYFLEDNKIVFFPEDVTSFPTIRVYYHRRPSELIKVTEASEVTVVNTGTNTVTVSLALPTGFVTGALLDIVQGDPNFALRANASAVVSITSQDIEFGAGVVDDVAVGDWVALTGESPIIQLPYEVHGWLAQATAIKVLESHGDSDVKVLQAKSKELDQNFAINFQPRVDDDPEVIVQYDNISDYL